MVWVVDGRRRKRDVVQLLKCIGPCAWGQPPFILHVASHEECALLRDWQSSTVPVYFDLGLCEHNGVSTFWRLDPVSRIGRMYLTPVSKESFLRVHSEGLDAEQKFSEGVSIIVKLFSARLNDLSRSRISDSTVRGGMCGVVYSLVRAVLPFSRRKTGNLDPPLLDNELESGISDLNVDATIMHLTMMVCTDDHYVGCSQ